MDKQHVSINLLVLSVAVLSLTWYDNRLNSSWHSLSSSVQLRVVGIWDTVRKLAGDEFTLFAFGTLTFNNFVFLIINLPYLFMDLTGYPKFLTQYKIQEGKNNPLTWEQLKNALSVIIPYNSFSIFIPALLYPLQKYLGIESGNDLPTLQRILVDILLSALLEEIMFYYSHRLLHHPKLYKRIHKIHHEWTAPISISCIYAHPIEGLISNYLPVYLSVTLVGSHLITCWIWFAIALCWTVKDHSGYHFPFLPSTEAHDYHHLKFNQNFGVFGILDWFHGTDKNFRKSIQSKRNHALFSFTPMKELIPDKI